ncbi:Uncharacterized protein TCM_007930 [Theobroma cacao]|uniref:Uncharacterized protein n=1 Tax=Theobroma cacao TaxID=3641 RepID=A0A061E3U4_THECC|nr:Uncharacterized protein TCM_007930 [Theobroma cacao]
MAGGNYLNKHLFLLKKPQTTKVKLASFPRCCWSLYTEFRFQALSPPVSILNVQGQSLIISFLSHLLFCRILSFFSLTPDHSHPHTTIKVFGWLWSRTKDGLEIHKQGILPSRIRG